MSIKRNLASGSRNPETNELYTAAEIAASKVQLHHGSRDPVTGHRFTDAEVAGSRVLAPGSSNPATGHVYTAAEVAASNVHVLNPITNQPYDLTPEDIDPRSGRPYTVMEIDASKQFKNVRPVPAPDQVAKVDQYNVRPGSPGNLNSPGNLGNIRSGSIMTVQVIKIQ